MMNNKISFLVFLAVPFFIFGQTIDNFDSEPAADYWGYEISENADTTLSYVNVSYVVDPLYEGSGAMQLDYSAHNIEAWGGYAKIFHMMAGEPSSPLEGTWMMAPEAGALMVGPAPNDGSWWSNTEEDVTTRACYFDDEYVFGADGSFQNVQGPETWLEVWQGVEADQCGAPVAPHDGSNPATWEFNAGTGQVTLSGVGAYLGLPKANNEGQLPDVAVPESITYEVTLSNDNQTMTLVIESGAGVFWTFKLVSDYGGDDTDTGIVFSGAFGGTIVDGNTYTFPTGAESWGGFANEDTSLYPFSFPDGGTIEFTGATAGADVDVYFRFEYNPYPDTEPSYNTDVVTVSGTDEASYSVEIPAQGENTFSSFLLYVTTPDAPVTLTDVTVTSGDEGIVFSGAFGGTIVDGNTYTFPTGAESWGGFANEDTSLYPFSFPDGGTIEFTGATAGADVDVYFRFEYNPYPDTEPSYNTDVVTVSGTDEASYSVEIPAQGENTFSSFLLYVTTPDAPVTLTDVTVTEYRSAVIRDDWSEDWMSIIENRNHGELWDWSGYDSISFSYYNSVSQSLQDRVHLRLNLSDFGDVSDPDNYTGLGEYYYSFHYILDNEPGWNTITMPLERNDSWDGGGFNLTGWAGEAGNGELDKDAIAGFHLEFSISGGGDGDYANGTIVLDDFKLTGSKNVLTNPGFELADENDDDFGWGVAMGGGHAEVITDASMAYSGDNYLSIGVTDNWAVYYTEDSIPAAYGETWSFSGFGKSVNGEEAGAFFKLEAKDAAGNVLESTGDVALTMTDEWENHTVEFVMPQGTVQMTAVIVASRWDGVPCDFAFDDMFLMNVGVLDVVPPAAVENVSATPASYYNLVTWSDVDGESGESYNVYASMEPITDSLSLAAADVVATGVLEGSQAAVHYLFNPLEDVNVSYHYAVICEDASNNVGEPGSSEGSISNMAKGIPTISLSVPADFAADGDLDEWYDSDIEPFFLGTEDNSWGTPSIVGDVDSDDDLSGEIWLAVDEDYLYIAADVIDDVYDGYQAGDGTNGWWENDVFELFIGFYDQRGAKHGGMERGDEPDYKFYFLETHAVNDFNSQDTLAVNGDGNYFHEGLDPDYILEARLSLDDIAFGDDIRLNALNGMRIPIEPTFHDNDGNGWEGNLVASPTNADNAWQTPSVWSTTWIGDQSMVSIDHEDGMVAYEFALYPNYPNPFNPATTIKFSIPETQQVTLKLYNIVGQEVVTLIDRELQAGLHTAKWNAGNMASGVYFYKLISGSSAITQKMLLVK